MTKQILSVRRNPSRTAVRPTLRRRAAILVVAIVTLGIVVLLGSELVQAMLRSHRQALQVTNQLQAEWIAEAALERARAMLERNADYAEESWQPTSLDDTGAENTSDRDDRSQAFPPVQISVQPTAEGDGRLIVVEAAFPDPPTQRAVARRELLVPNPQPETMP